MKKSKWFSKHIGLVILAIVSLILLQAYPVFAADPQSQKDCPAGTTFVPGGAISDTGNIANPTATPNQCKAPNATAPTVTITCPDGSQVNGVTPNLSPDQQKLVCDSHAAGLDNPVQNTNTIQPSFAKSDCQGNIKAGLPEGSPGHCGILDYLTLAIKVLSGLVGVIVVIMIIIGGIQYSASRGDPSGVAAAKKRITNAILALVVYAFIFAFLQYLIPGGILQ